MKILSSFLFAGIVVISFSCNKDAGQQPNPDPVPTEPGTASGLLIKSVRTRDIAHPEDSIVTVYEYDSNKRLVKEINRDYPLGVGPLELGQMDAVCYYRDATGRIIQTVYKPTPDNGSITDSIRINVFYENNSTNRIAYTLTKYDNSIQKKYDSVDYEYDASNHVSSVTSFHSSDTSLYPLTPFSYKELQFGTNSNLLNMKLYQLVITNNTDTSFNLQYDYDFVYDDKINPLFSEMDDIITIAKKHSKNNITMEKIYEIPVNMHYNNTNAFTYNAGNKPILRQRTSDYFIPTPISTIKYYYSK